jgi:hypothetical protein
MKKARGGNQRAFMYDDCQNLGNSFWFFPGLESQMPPPIFCCQCFHDSMAKFRQGLKNPKLFRVNFGTKTKNMKPIPQYFKRVFDDYQVLVKVNPTDFSGIELIVHPDGRVEKTEMAFDEEIFEDLEVDEFQPGGALEFNLYLAKANP